MPSALQVHRLTNSIFNSNTYLATVPGSGRCFIVDAGDPEHFARLHSQGMQVEAVLITHAHYDHIYGLNTLARLFPQCTIYASPRAIEGLYSPRLNYSLYHQASFAYTGHEPAPVEHGQTLLLSQCPVRAIATPGHDSGAMSYEADGFLFTGDSLIPGTPTVTNLRGNRREAAISEAALLRLAESRCLSICPGHGPISTSQQLQSNG